MLDVLLREGIHDAAVVVTRYFGGVLLGTGGLVRAYQKAVQAGLAASEIAEKQHGQLLTVGTDYAGYGKLQYLFAQECLHTLDTSFTADVQIDLLIPMADRARIEKLITERTSATATLRWGDEVDYAISQKEVILL